MTDIQCCACGSWTRGIEHLLKGGYLTVQSSFTKSAGESCDNCGHDFCEECTQMESEVEELYKKYTFITQKIRSVRSLKSLIHWYRKLFDVEKRLWELRTFSDYFLKTCSSYQWTKYTYDKDEIKRMCEDAST